MQLPVRKLLKIKVTIGVKKCQPPGRVAIKGIAYQLDSTGQVVCSNEITPNTIDVVSKNGLKRRSKRYATSELLAKESRDRKYMHLKSQGMVLVGMEEEIRRLIARRKIQATLGRYLVISCGWKVTRPIILRAALAKSQLGLYVMSYSLLSLERERLGLVATIRIAQIMEQMEKEGLPGILGQPDTWASVNIHHEIPSNNLFFFRGNCDAIIVDKQRNCHLISAKTVRVISPSHILQTLLHRLVIDLRGLLNGLNYVYEANRNVLVAIDPTAIMALSRYYPCSGTHQPLLSGGRQPTLLGSQGPWYTAS